MDCVSLVYYCRFCFSLVCCSVMSYYTVVFRSLCSQCTQLSIAFPREHVFATWVVTWNFQWASSVSVKLMMHNCCTLLIVLLKFRNPSWKMCRKWKWTLNVLLKHFPCCSPRGTLTSVFALFFLYYILFSSGTAWIRRWKWLLWKMVSMSFVIACRLNISKGSICLTKKAAV